MEGKKVLIVDDSKMQLMMLNFCLNDLGYTDIIQAYNGEEALAIAKEQKFDLVISDINMPKMHGLALVKMLRNMPEYEHTPILIVSTASSDTTIAAAKEAGACAYIKKPFATDSIKKAIDKLIINGKC
ncbi:MAG: hypothetical protein RL154_350 [Pseudomonadota bacterium]